MEQRDAALAEEGLSVVQKQSMGRGTGLVAEERRGEGGMREVRSRGAQRWSDEDG